MIVTTTMTMAMVMLIGTVLTTPAYAGGAAFDHDEAYEDIPGANECWYDGYEDGQNNPFSQDRNEECEDKGNQYYRAFLHGCESVEGNSKDSCEKATDAD